MELWRIMELFELQLCGDAEMVMFQTPNIRQTSPVTSILGQITYLLPN
jgi:hypothetical protein